ncbi:SDR family oxidoreductase [Sodalis-like symbiont of Bactericera trigonica]|nr:SDR family oxidoreductase [Sodalis-like symbiont of Bactericera trigonica]
MAAGGARESYLLQRCGCHRGGQSDAGGGGIVNIAGASAHRCCPGAGAYGPAKTAIINLTRQMAVEWVPYGIRVNGVSPGPVRDDTPWQQQEPRRWRRK